MVEIAICDDERVFCEMLAQKTSAYMERSGEPFNISSFSCAEELLSCSCRLDILLLDIQMPGTDGMRLARKLREMGSHSAIIFVTAIKEQVWDAFELEAVDYICKPIDENRLHDALKRALKRTDSKTEKQLFIKRMNWCQSVKISDIYYCEVINRKVYLHTSRGVIDYYSKIENVEEQLDYRFVRCHRSYLVNLDHFAKYANGFVTLADGAQIPVSRLRHQAFMDAMMQYMKRKEA